MNVGLLPALGSGLGDLAATGQVARLVDGYFQPYTRAFERVYYVSYLPETLARFTADTELVERVTVLAPVRPAWRGWRAVTIPFVHEREVRQCAVLRVFQLTGVIPALLARARFGIPYVTTYGFSYGRLSRPGPTRILKSALERVGLRRAAAVIATTETLRTRAAALGARAHLVPNGVDTERFAPPREPRIVARERRVLYVGRLSPEKNISAVIAALGHLRGSLAARLVVAGDGPLRERLVAEARDAGVTLELLGVVPQPALPDVYRSADAFVLASFTEGHPKALVEAMAAGLPCVVSDCEGNRSLVTNGVTGLVFEARRPDELADQLRRVLTDADLAGALGHAARTTAVEHYDLGTMVAREIELLRSVAGMSPATAVSR